MVSFNITGEDYSPLITYSPANAWQDSPSTNALVASSSGSTLHATTAQGASATVQFEGTGIWFMGSKGPNYGTYTISVDGKVVQQGSAQSGSPAAQQLLGGVFGLSNGKHEAVLKSTGSALDLDSFMFETAVKGVSVSNTTIDDADPSISYGPSPSDWQTNNGDTFISNTLHYTQTGGATATYKFNGDAVALYGTVSPDHANYSVTLDGEKVNCHGGSDGVTSALRSQALLYFAGSLNPQEHTIVVTADPDHVGQSNTGRFMDIDAITVYTASGSNAVATNNGSDGGRAAGHVSEQHSKSNAGVIAGAVIGAFIGLLLIALLVFLLLRRRANARRQPPSPLTPALPLQGPGMAEAGFGGVAKGAVMSESLAPAKPVPTFAPPPPPAVQAAPAVRDFSSHYHTRSLSRSSTSDSGHSRTGSRDSLASADSGTRLIAKPTRTATLRNQHSRSPSPSGLGRSLTATPQPSRPSTRPPSLAVTVANSGNTGVLPARPSRPSIDEPFDRGAPRRPSRPETLVFTPVDGPPKGPRLAH